MENLLPTITVIMAEASLALLVVIGILLYRHARRKRQYRAEIESLMEIVQDRRGVSPATAKKGDGRAVAAGQAEELAGTAAAPAMAAAAAATAAARPVEPPPSDAVAAAEAPPAASAPESETSAVEEPPPVPSSSIAEAPVYAGEIPAVDLSSMAEASAMSPVPVPEPVLEPEPKAAVADEPPSTAETPTMAGSPEPGDAIAPTLPHEAIGSLEGPAPDEMRTAAETAPEPSATSEAPLTDAAAATDESLAAAIEEPGIVLTEEPEMIDLPTLKPDETPHAAIRNEPAHSEEATTAAASPSAGMSSSDSPGKGRAASAAELELIARGLMQISQTIELMDARMGQIRNDHHKLAAYLHHALGKAESEAAYTRREIDALGHLLHEIRRQLRIAAAAAPAQSPAPANPSPATKAAPAPPAMADTAIVNDAAADAAESERHGAAIDRLLDAQLFGLEGDGIAVEEISLSEFDIDETPDDTGDKAEAQPERPFSDKDQIFFQSSTEESRQGWYFSMGGEQPRGPFASKQGAERMLAELKGQSRRPGRTALGG